MSTAPALPLLSFDQATAAQRTEALLTARQLVGAAFPTYSYPQWQRAFEELRPRMQPGPGGEPTQLAPEELVQLLHQLVSPPNEAWPAGALFPPEEPLPLKPARKQTYQLPEALIERLERISYWRRRPINQLVAQAVARLVTEYPTEAARLLPPPPAD